MATSDFLDIVKWAEQARQDVVVGSAEKVRALFSDVVMFSPEPVGGVGPTGKYSTGRFIANWNVGITPIVSTTNSTQTKAAKIAEIRSVIDDNTFLTYDQVFLMNGLSYAKNVEYNGWQITGPYRPMQNAVGDFVMTGPSPAARAVAKNL